MHTTSSSADFLLTSQTDAADPLRKQLIEASYGPHLAEIIGKYADNPAVVEPAALNIQYLYGPNPAAWDAMQPLVAGGVVAALVGALGKSSASTAAVAAVVEALAFVAHVDANRRKGDWNVIAKLADLDAWSALTNTALGKHGRSGRVAAAVMTLLHKSCSSPKATNFIRGIASAGLLSTALSYMRRSLVSRPQPAGADGRERSVSPVRPGTSHSTARPVTAASGTGRSGMGASMTMSSTRSMGSTLNSLSSTSSSNGQHNGPARLRSYAEEAWHFVRECAAKTPETVMGGDPEAIVRLLLEPMLQATVLTAHAKLALGVLAPLINSEIFLQPFVSNGGISVLTALTSSMLRIDIGGALKGCDILFTLADNPILLPYVLEAGGFQAVVETYFVSWETKYNDEELLQKLANGLLKLVVDNEQLRSNLAHIVLQALSSHKGDAAPRHVSAAACLITWSQQLHPDMTNTFLVANSADHICGAIKAFALRDEVLARLVHALRTLVPVSPIDLFIDGHYALNGGSVVTSIIDFLRASLKRDTPPDMPTWTSLFEILEGLINASAANKAAFLRYPTLLPMLCRFTEWSIRVCDADVYKEWRLATRPPPPKDLKEDPKTAAANNKKKGSRKEEQPAEPEPPQDLPPQWVPARLVRLVMIYCADGGNANAVASIRASLLHRKVGDYVWPWVCALVDGGLEEGEVDGGVTRAFLASGCWRVASDGPYQGWEASAPPADIRAMQKKFPSWKPDPSYLQQ